MSRCRPRSARATATTRNLNAMGRDPSAPDGTQRASKSLETEPIQMERVTERAGLTFSAH